MCFELMNLLTKPLREFTFEDIERFCVEMIPEGIQLDYKADLSEKGLSKHFAAFSNTRGGVIIIGIQEDRAKGVPIKWEGISNYGKLAEQINQHASNVEPRPTYEICITNEKKGKVFILLRISEGDRTPYYVHNDSNLWIRTGNISDPLDIASPEIVELLFGKKHKAESLRKSYLQRSDEVFAAALDKAEKERIQEIAIAKRKPNYDSSQYLQVELGSNASMCKIVLQPFFPKTAFAKPSELKEKLNEIRVNANSYSSFPELNVRAIPEGTLALRWNKNGVIDCEQIYANGLFYHNEDVLGIDDNKKRNIYISHIAANLYQILVASNNFYTLFGYQGGIVGSVTLRNAADVDVHPIIPDGMSVHTFFHLDKELSLLPNYQWLINVDTSTLNNKEPFEDFFVNFLRDVYWDLGIEQYNEEYVKLFLEKNLSFQSNL